VQIIYRHIEPAYCMEYVPYLTLLKAPLSFLAQVETVVLELEP
jgi:hypothetical protein